MSAKKTYPSVKFQFLLILLFGLSTQITTAQPWHWALSAGGDNSETGNAITVSPLNQPWVLGSFQQSAIFNNDTLTAYGEEDMLLLKLSTSGQVVKAIGGGSTSDDAMSTITSDSTGNIYVAGRYWDQAIFGTDTLNKSYGSSSALFLLKYNDNGQLIWKKSIEGNGLKWAQKVKIGPNGNLFLAGYFRNDLNIDQTIFPAEGLTDSFIAEFDTSGLLLTIKTFGTQGVARISGFGFDSNENLYAAGHFEGKLKFANDSIETLSMGFDVFALKYSAAGNPTWLKRAGGVFEDYCNDVVVDQLGQMTLAGNFFGVLAFDNYSLSTTGFNEDAYIARLDASGNTIWAKSYGATNNETFTAIQQNANKLFVSGHFFTQTSLESSVFTTNPNETDGFLMTVLDDGTFESAYQIVGDGYDLFNGSALAPDGSIYLTGEYQTELTAGNQITPFGLYDLFVVKTNPLPVPTEQIAQDAELKLFPNPASNRLFIELPGRQQFNTIELYDSFGRVLFHQMNSNHQNSTTVNLVGLEDGVYWLKLSSPSNQWIEKIIVIN